jgi:hypothetical protein
MLFNQHEAHCRLLEGMKLFSVAEDLQEEGSDLELGCPEYESEDSTDC